MTGPVLTKEGQEALAGILMMRPPFMQGEQKKRIFRVLSLLMNEQGAKEAGRELVIEAVRLVLPPTYNANIHRVEDPDKLRRLSAAEKVSAEAYYTQSVQVKRWNIPEGKAIKRPADMKVLAFCASPRVGGNTDTLIDEALRGAEDAGARVEKIRLQKIKLNFCTHCAKCREPGYDGFCVQKDDMSSIYPKMVEANAIIIGFPIYIGRECGQIATFFDRWYCFERTRLGTGRLGMVIGTWGLPWADNYDFIMERAINVMGANGVVTVEALSACGFEGTFRGRDNQGKAIIRSFPGELEKAYQAGKSLVTG